jgi:lysophospholipase L1-like esterase
MRVLFVPFLFCILLSGISHAQKKTISVIGSSSAYGFGATPIDSSWVNLTKKYYQGLGILDTIYNLGNPSTTSYAGMPDNFIPPTKRPVPDPKHNVTKALSYNPDIVIVNYPSNDIGDDFTMTEFLFNLRTIYNIVIAAGKLCYITTTQPRDFFSPTEKKNLKIGRDSILREFGIYSLDFYDPVVDTATLDINPIYNFDGTHVNNAGYQLFFQVVKSKNIFAIATPVFSLTSFNPVLQNNTVAINWSTINDQASNGFEVQRSTDSLAFQTIYQQNGKGGTPTAFYSWIDVNPLSGKSFYRLKITAGGLVSYSGIVGLVNIITPVFSLTSFNSLLQTNTVQINWSTLNDQPSNGFEVQRSTDSLAFQTIFQENAKGGTPTAFYSWIDVNPLSGKSFYRLKITAGGIVSYSGIVGLVNIITPVFSLTNFNAGLQNNTVVINWSTLNDQLSTGFEIQRSTDSLVFQTIFQETGTGGTPTASYSWTDINPLSGKSFYRLKITANGPVSYSGIVSVVNIITTVFSLTSFNAVLQNNTVQVNWSTLNDQPSTGFEVQRSNDSLYFETIHQENGTGGTPTASYSWTDINPLSGKSFYRLKISINGTVTYSDVIILVNIEKSFSIARMYVAGKNSKLVVNLIVKKKQALILTIINTSGAIISMQSYNIETPSTNIPVNITSLAYGTYYLRIRAANGDQETRPFLNF